MAAKALKIVTGLASQPGRPRIERQPIRRFGFDAAILFSDILVVPEAMGQRYSFREGGGVQMEFEINSAAPRISSV